MNRKIRWNMFKSYYWNYVMQLGWHKTEIVNSIFNLWVALWNHREEIIKILKGKYLYVKQVDLVLTTKCSLRCKECANLMQYYNRPYDIELDSICKSINALVNKVDEIGTVVLVGGEPFLYDKIDYVIERVIDEEKINDVNIYTNGSVIPTEKVLNILKESKCKIIVSDYGELSKKKHELVNECEKRNIRYYLKSKDLVWGNVGDMNCRNRDEKQLKKQFIKCNNFCRSILNGKLFYCPRASHGDDLGYIDTKSEEYVNLLDENLKVEEIIELLYSTHYFTACNYCNYGTKDFVPVIPGEQLTYIK